MLRGRLDGAERLITAILPDSDAETMREREHYIQEAQEAIAKEWQGFKDGLNLDMSVENRHARMNAGHQLIGLGGHDRKGLQPVPLRVLPRVP